MTTAIQLRERLCAMFCQDMAVVERAGGLAVTLPMAGRDGDAIVAYVSSTTAGWRVSDNGVTLMRLSYEHDLAKLLSGARERLFNTVLQESGLQEDDGELFTEVPADELSRGLFTLGQGITRLEDLGLWTRGRVESSFTDDLRAIILEAAGVEHVQEGYIIPELPGAENYPVDFFVATPYRPLYVFGVPNRDKARLATIILQHLLAHHQRFDSMVVFADMDEIPRADTKRLLLAANDSVPAIDERLSIKAKIAHRLSA